VPLAEQLGDTLRKQILAGKLGRNGRLPSVRELAQQHNVSKSTVANVISSLKRQGLLHTAFKRGVYVADGKAPATTKKKRTGTIGVYARGTGDILCERIYFDAFNAVCKSAEEQGSTVLYLGNDDGTESDPLSIPLGMRDIDGLIYIVTSEPSQKFLREMLRRSMPLLMMDTFDERFDCVMIDNIGGSWMAMQRLLEKGHRRIAFLNSTHGQSAVERLAVYREALEKNGIKFDPRLVSNSLPIVGDCREAMRALLKHGPTAVFTFGDYHALGAIIAAEALGFAVPQDLSVMSFGNQAGTFAEGMGKHLCTIDANMPELGRLSAGLLLKRIADPGRPVESVRVKCRFVEGNTISRCPAASNRRVLSVQKRRRKLV
jgi:DNA-binding LacI/PurR family transcriptional regulator